MEHNSIPLNMAFAMQRCKREVKVEFGPSRKMDEVCKLKFAVAAGGSTTPPILSFNMEDLAVNGLYEIVKGMTYWFLLTKGIDGGEGGLVAKCEIVQPIGAAPSGVADDHLPPINGWTSSFEKDQPFRLVRYLHCLLYTSDAADE